MPLRFDDVAAERRLRAPIPGRRASREVVAPRSSTTHSGPASGEIHYRRLDADAGSSCRPSCTRATGRARRSSSARAAERLGARHLRLPGQRRRRGRQHRRRARAAPTAPRWHCARHRRPCRSRRSADGTVRGARAEARAKTRIFARLRWRRRRGSERDGAFRRRRGALAADWSTPTAPASPGARLRVVSPALARCPRPAAVEPSRTGAHGGFRLVLPPGPSRRITVSFAGDEELDRARRAPLLRCGCAAASSSTPRPRASRPASRSASGAGCAPAARRCRGAASSSRSSTTRRRPALAAGDRHPQRPQRALPGSLPVPLRQRHGADPDARGRASPRSAGPTCPAPLAGHGGVTVDGTDAGAVRVRTV